MKIGIIAKLKVFISTKLAINGMGGYGKYQDETDAHA